ncbi:MAG: cystathionine gamma-synthase family protein [Marinilabiliaceae bacterium]|nr:cystathionine gamma-synthase family protein [Marinilabiliaceae bacterium]
MDYKEFSPESLMMSYAYNAEDHQGSIKCPLYQTSTFVFQSAEEGKAFFEIAYGLRAKCPNEKLGMIYSRLNNPTLDLAEKRLAAYEGAEEALFFSSGMGAISTTVLTFLKPGDVLLYASPVYGGTEHLFNHALPGFNIGIVKFYAGETEETIINRVSKEFPGKKPKIIYIEVPGNPTNSLIDIEMCARLAEHYKEGDCKPLLVVDNTFLGPVFQHPLQHGADISLYSATKFIGGHSDLVGGACVGFSNPICEIRVMRSFLGSMMDPHSAWLVLRSLETLKIRMEQQAIGAAKVAEHLAKHPKIERVSYLGLLKNGEQGKDIYDKQCSFSGSMISFYIKGGEKEAYQFLNNLHLFKLAVSLGSTESLAEHPATMTHIDVPDDEKQRLGINEQLIRLSIGLEKPEDLIKAIDEAFRKVG